MLTLHVGGRALAEVAVHLLHHEEHAGVEVPRAEVGADAIVNLWVWVCQEREGCVCACVCALLL